MNARSTLGELAGACTLTLLNESIRKLDKGAPRMRDHSRVYNL